MGNTQVKLTNVAANNRILNKYGEDVTGAKGIPLSDGTVQYPNIKEPNIEAVNYAKQHYTYAHMKPSLTAADRAFLEEQGFEDTTLCRRVSDAALFNPAWKPYTSLIITDKGGVFDLDKQEECKCSKRGNYMFFQPAIKVRTIGVHAIIAYSFASEDIIQACRKYNMLANTRELRGKKGIIKLEPDHINGVGDDNRLENLQIVLEHDNKSVLKTSRK